MISTQNDGLVSNDSVSPTRIIEKYAAKPIS